jgi:hypothetical protein
VFRTFGRATLRVASAVALLMGFWSLMSFASSNTANASTEIPKCFMSQLKMTADEGGGAYSAAGNQGVAFVFLNIGDNACSLKGYPKFRFEPSSFKGRSIKITHGGGGIFASVSPRRIVLEPNAAASFGIDYGDAYNQSPIYNGASCMTRTASAWVGVRARPNPIPFTAALKINFCFADFKFSVTPLQRGRTPKRF